MPKLAVGDCVASWAATDQSFRARNRAREDLKRATRVPRGQLASV